jgi:acyl-CoA thioester hydrolase
MSLRFTIPEHKKLVHEMTLPMRWGDMDAMGHINNTIYFRYMEIVRLEWIASLGMTLKPEGCGMLIINACCTFIRQLEFPGEVRARLFVADVGRTSFDTYTTLERADTPGMVYAEGGAKIVWTDFSAQKSALMPDWVRAVVD